MLVDVGVGGRAVGTSARVSRMSVLLLRVLPVFHNPRGKALGNIRSAKADVVRDAAIGRVAVGLAVEWGKTRGGGSG